MEPGAYLRHRQIVVGRGGIAGRPVGMASIPGHTWLLAPVSTVLVHIPVT
jgi:hypothetical protein